MGSHANKTPPTGKQIELDKSSLWGKLWIVGAVLAAAGLGSWFSMKGHDEGHAWSALLTAYFADNRDISDPGTLQAIWTEVGLPLADFDRLADPALLDRVIAEHNEAVRAGITGVPAAMLAGTDAPISGALPLASYRRWIERAIETG